MEQHNQHEKLQVQKMQEDLVILRSFLENNLLQLNKHKELQSLWNRVVEVAYKADFVIGSLIVGDISFYSLTLFCNTIEEIKLVAKNLEIDGKKYVIDAQKGMKSLRDVPSHGCVSTMNEVVVGLKDEVLAIIDQLIGGSKHFNVISIVGMPGIGNTTLARKVYHDHSITSHFVIRAWCCISQVYCMKICYLRFWLVLIRKLNILLWMKMIWPRNFVIS
ncbi:hypothetical protein ACH5RR_021305 [Cinchona calisaya]|uniref:NB-ARC domain-containing protein n=1 Tax=Cinchona calisaya TaxID=153742 RepID=A0ABD2ZGX9_9GENT